jgi:hypothetical protein
MFLHQKGIAKPSESDLSATLSVPEQTAGSPMNATDRPEDVSPETHAWLQRSVAGLQRMATDENYRLEIAKRIS